MRSIYECGAEHTRFCNYVTEQEEQERHTLEAVRSYDEFERYVISKVSDQDIAYGILERAMLFAIEYEESGFIAAVNS